MNWFPLSKLSTRTKGSKRHKRVDAGLDTNSPTTELTLKLLQEKVVLLRDITKTLLVKVVNWSS